MWNEDKEAEAEGLIQAIGEGEDIRWDFHSEIFHQDICKVFGGGGFDGPWELLENHCEVEFKRK